MTIAVDTSKAFRFPAELRQLVRAVHGADPANESTWIEWKETLDLTQPSHIGHVVRHVLGFANREPRAAAHFAEGYGYMLAGVEPGNLAGLAPIDPGDLVSKVGAFLGDGIGWHPEFIDVDGVTVLVVAVDPPRLGDPIHCLHKVLGNMELGTILIRRAGQTGRAGPAELKMLQNRLMAGAPGLEVRVKATPAQVESLSMVGPLIEAAAARLRRPAESAQLGEPLVGLSGLVADIAATGARRTAAAADGQYASGLVVQDRRTPEQYDEEVAAYLGELESALVRRSVILAARMPGAQLRLCLENGTQRNFAQVKVTAVVDGVRSGKRLAKEKLPALPTEPRRLGVPKVVAPASYFGFDALANLKLGGTGNPLEGLDVELLTRPDAPRIVVDERDSGVRITYPAVDLRPGHVYRLGPVALLVPAGTEAIAVRWSATALNVDGTVSGIEHVAIVASTLAETTLRSADH